MTLLRSLTTNAIFTGISYTTFLMLNMNRKRSRDLSSNWKSRHFLSCTLEIATVCIEISTKVYVCSVHFVLKPNYFGRFVSTLSDVEHEQKKVKGFEFKKELFC